MEEAAPDHARNDLLAHLTAHLGDGLVESHLAPGDDLWIRVTRDSWVAAAEYLEQNNVAIKDFNSFGSRRGNDRVMTRGTFGNIRLKNCAQQGTTASPLGISMATVIETR